MSNFIGNNYYTSLVNNCNVFRDNLVDYACVVKNQAKKNICDLFSNIGGKTTFHISSFFNNKNISLIKIPGIVFTYLKNRVSSNIQLKNQLEIHVDPSQANSILKVLTDLFNREQVNELRLLTGGRGTSKIFKFSVQGKDYVLRVTDTNRPNFFIDVESEMRNMKTIESLNISPTVHYSNAEDGIIVMDYIENIRLTTQVINHEEESEVLYGKLASSLRNLHTGPLLSGDVSSVFDDIRRITDTLDTSKMPPEASQIVNSILEIEKVLKKHQTSAPCHKELNGNNVLYDGNKIFFIDWEGSGNCDPFVDIAISTVFFIFDEKNEAAFLRHYFEQDPTQEQKAYLFLMKHVIHSFYFFKSVRRLVGLWKMDLSHQKNGLAGLPNYKDFVLEFFNGCSKVCNTKDFQTLTYVFLEQALKSLNSTEFKNAIEILS